MQQTTVKCLVICLAVLACGNSFAQAPAQPDLGPRLARAAQRLQEIGQGADRIGDYNTLRNLQQQWGYYIDKALWDEAVDLFTDDGSIELGLNGVYVGKPAMRSYLYSLSGGKAGLLPGQLNNHFIRSPVITLSADATQAKARWHDTIQDGIHGQSANWGAGVYENTYVKQGGVWKIATLHYYPRFHASYEGGWTHATAASTRGYGKSAVKPTRGPSVTYDTWPAAFTAPAHFDNPARSDYRLNSAPQGSATASSGKSVTELEAQVRALELKIDRLRSFDEVENLESTYGYYADKSMQDAISALFTDNAWLEILGRGVFLGRDRVYEYMRRLGAPTYGTLFNHMQIQPVIHITPDGNTATIRSRLVVMYGLLDRSAQWGDGIYENVFVRENGVWKYQVLNGYQTFYTDYDKGWGKHSAAMFSPFAGYPPDLPQSVTYDPWPAPFIPPFSYRHPVTGK